jgi:hypothetical protein
MVDIVLAQKAPDINAPKARIIADIPSGNAAPFLGFMNSTVDAFTDREVHVILDKLNTHNDRTGLLVGVA